MKRITAMLLFLVLTLSLASTALAVDPPDSKKPYSEVPTEGTPAKGNVGSAEGQLLYTPKSGGIEIYTWRNSITELSPGYVKCYCLTITDFLADKVENDYVLQRWNGSSWVSYSTSQNWDLFTDFLGTNIYRYVAQGYYYRVMTTHRGWLGLGYDQEVLYSSYIYVP